MYHRTITTVLAVAVCVQMMLAATVFHTRRLADIAVAVGLKLPDKALTGQNDSNAGTWQGHRLRVMTDAFGDVSHIGYSLFDDAMMTDFGHEQVLCFVERYLLELDLRLDGRAPAARMDLDKVVCPAGNISILHTMAAQAAFTIENITRRMYRMKWTTGTQTLTLTIPADYQLLAGADAVELEDIFERDLQRVISLQSDDVIDDWADAGVARSGDMLIADGGMYLSDMIRSDIYLMERNGSRSLINDAAKPRQSVSNIMLTGRHGTAVPLELTLDRYGYRQSKTRVTVQQLVDFFRMEGCKLYFGIKTHTSDRITGTLFALNEAMAYNHVISIDFPLSILGGTGGDDGINGSGDGGAAADTVKGTAYVYIPLQNVTEKFFNQDLNNYNK